MMKQICLLVAVFMLASVISRDIDNERREYHAESSFEDIKHNVRRQEVTENPRIFCENITLTESMVRYPPMDNEQFSTYVVIYSGTEPQMCGGGIIDEFTVVTSAFCASAFTSMPWLIFGFHPDRPPWEQSLQAKNITLYNETSERGETDFALIEVKPDRNGRGIMYSNRAKPLCRQIGLCPIDLTTILTMTVLERYNATSRSLRSYTLTPIADSVCSTQSFNITPLMMCTRRSPPSDDTCEFSLGSPALYRYGDRYLNTAIVSRCLDNNIVILSFSMNSLCSPEEIS